MVVSRFPRKISIRDWPRNPALLFGLHYWISERELISVKAGSILTIKFDFSLESFWPNRRLVSPEAGQMKVLSHLPHLPITTM